MKRILLQGPNDGDPVNADEKCLKPEYNQALMKLGTCTTCGLCVSECPAMEGGAFIPPYIFVKGQAVADDPRVDSAIKKMLLNRLKPYAEYCLMCGKCAAVCPASLSPEAELKKLFP
jgi:succinate dehydrogenase/fumarate reductase-like Fe-S protein